MVFAYAKRETRVETKYFSTMIYFSSFTERFVVAVRFLWLAHLFVMLNQPRLWLVKKPGTRQWKGEAARPRGNLNVLFISLVNYVQLLFVHSNTNDTSDFE